jgi:S-adenosylmethionine:tRNA ribosyltransferase-isomerase
VSGALRLADFDFDLPESAIALRPVSPRDAARMLVVRPDAAPPLTDAAVRDLPDLLAPGDLMVFNDTRVIPAQLAAVRLRGGDGEPAGTGQAARPAPQRIAVTLHKRLDEARWLAFLKPGRRARAGDRLAVSDSLSAEVESKSDAGDVTLRFSLAGPALDAAIAAAGIMPLPPYIAGRRPGDARDRADYQTVYAARDGAVAAPTAGLHFTPELLAALDARGVARRHVTLHVGAGTFLPVKVDDVRDHRMHAEWGEVPAETADAIHATRSRGGRIVAVGTTSLRLLESAAQADGAVRPFSGDTAIFITPGYRFRAVDALMTNFHLPKSTLFMLVSAFSGLATMRAAYAHAVATGYRFYSYGDSSLLFREGER